MTNPSSELGRRLEECGDVLHACDAALRKLEESDDEGEEWKRV